MTFWDAALVHVYADAPAQLPALRSRALVEPRERLEAAAHGIREHAFSHQILHQVTYDTVLKRVKRAAHARVADWLARHTGVLGTRLLAAAAEHYERAGDAVNAAEHYARAAAHMVDTFAHEAAIESSRADWHCSARPTSTGAGGCSACASRPCRCWGAATSNAPTSTRWRPLADALPPGAPGDRSRAEAARRRSDFAHRIGDWALQEREARRCVALGEAAGDDALALRGTRRLAEALALQGDPATGRALAESALARAKALGLDQPESGLLVAVSRVHRPAGGSGGRAAAKPAGPGAQPARRQPRKRGGRAQQRRHVVPELRRVRRGAPLSRRRAAHAPRARQPGDRGQHQLDPFRARLARGRRGARPAPCPGGRRHRPRGPQPPLRDRRALVARQRRARARPQRQRRSMRSSAAARSPARSGRRRRC